MGQPLVMPRVPDGYRDRLLDLADRLGECAGDLRSARHDRDATGVAMIHASIDAERLVLRIEDELRRLRR